MSAPALAVSVFWGAVDDASQVSALRTFEAHTAESGFRRVRRVDDLKAVFEADDQVDADAVAGVLNRLAPDALVAVHPGNNWDVW